MRRLSFEFEDEEEEEVNGDGKGFYLPRVSSEAPRPRRSFHRSSPSLVSALSFVSLRKSFSYDKIVPVPTQLTIVKLDGSSFDIDVTKTATIAELKHAVESAFSHLPTKGPEKISWRHVWGHFCLSYGGRKLLNDSECIKDYGIKDGDELHFVRHVSIAYNLIKKRSRKRIDAPKPDTLPENMEEQFEQVKKDYEDDVENMRCEQYNYKCGQEEDNSTQDESMLSQLCRRWFLYSRLPSMEMENLKFRGDESPTRWPGGFVGCFRSLFRLYDNKPPSYSSRASQVQI